MINKQTIIQTYEKLGNYTRAAEELGISRQRVWAIINNYKPPSYNPQYWRKQNKKYYLENKQKIIARVKKRYQQNLENNRMIARHRNHLKGRVRPLRRICFFCEWEQIK